MELKTCYLAGGCFWGIERFFSYVKGVIDTDVGYADSNMPNPSYEEVCQGISSGAETVKITYDEDAVSFRKILELFLRVIDPFSLNKQGGDEGLQYRTAVFYVSSEQKEEARSYFKEREKEFHREFAVLIEPLKNFYKAEEYHQDYLIKNPFGYCHIDMGLLKEDERKK